MKLFVTGASGFVGRAFIGQLRRHLPHNALVYLLVRTPMTVDDPRFVQLAGDLAAIDTFADRLLECDYVYHLAANATYGSNADYDETNYRPVVRMMDILRQSRVLRNFIFTSTIGAVDRAPEDHCLRPLTQASRPTPRSLYGESKLKAEQCVTASGIPWTIIRPTWVYGPQMRTNSHINTFASMVYRGSPVARLNFPGRVSLIHVDDLARSLVHALGNDHIVGQCYFAETEALSLGKILRLLSTTITGRESRQLPVPSLRPLVGRLHARLPLAIANLFVDYLWAADDRYRQDFRLDRTIAFANGLHDVIATNVQISGHWAITGANSGIGLALARLLDNAGRRLVLIDRETGNLAQFAGAEVLNVDLGDREQLQQLGELLAGHKLACLVNNAGVGFRKPLVDLTMGELEQTIAVNVQAPVTLTRQLLPRLVADGTTIVNVASSIAYNPLPFMSLYAASKAFLSSWSESLTYELRETNRVITFSPAGTLTNFQQNAGVKVMRDGKGLLTPDTVAAAILKSVKGGGAVVIMGLATNILLLCCRFLPRRVNIQFWGRLFAKCR